MPNTLRQTKKCSPASMQVSPCRAPNAGLLTASAMFSYSAMLLWGALSDEPPDDLCSMHNSTGSNGLKVRSASSLL